MFIRHGRFDSMNALSFYTGLYGRLRCDFFPYWLLSPIRRVVKKLANVHIPFYLKHKTKCESPTEEDLIVSFTSFPSRINNVWQVVECFKNQTVLPKKIILWLSREQFPTLDSLPPSIVNRLSNLFEVRFVAGDIRSHKKYYYSCMEFPDKMIFLIDDDLYYPPDILEKSLIEYNKNNNCVVCNYGSVITYDKDGKHLPYSKWSNNLKGESVFFGSGGGTLFRPLDLYKDVTNLNLSLKLTPTADDIWLNTMARLNNMKIICISNKVLLGIYNDTTELFSINNGLNQNDVQLSLVEEYYGRCFDNNIN